MAHAMSEKPILREVRAAVFAAVCVVVAIIGHDAFSPGGIPLWLLAASAGILFVAVRPLTSRERGLPSILGAMATVQLGLHQAFATVQQHSATAATASATAGVTPATHKLPALGLWWCGPNAPAGIAKILTGYSPSALHAAGIATTGMSMPSAHRLPMAPMPMTPGMLTAHIVAALIAVWWLRHGEASAWSLARALATRVVHPMNQLAAAHVPWTPPKAARAAFSIPDRVGPGALIRFIVDRRGPPAFAAAL